MRRTHSCMDACAGSPIGCAQGETHIYLRADLSSSARDTQGAKRGGRIILPAAEQTDRAGRQVWERVMRRKWSSLV